MTQHTQPEKDKLRGDTIGKLDGADDAPNQNPLSYKSNKKFDYDKAIIPAAGILTGALTGMAAPELVDASGFLGVAKVGAIAIGSAFVSIVVNTAAIKSGTELTARGFKLAALASVAPIIIVGGAAMAFSYSGLTLKPVNELNLQEHGQELSTYSESVNSHAAQITQLIPVVQAAASDIQRNLECEVTAGCLSNGRGGKGPAYRALLPMASQAQEIATQLDAGETLRKNQLVAINELNAEYQTGLSNTDLSFNERRQIAARNSSKIKQEVGPLREALPLSLLRGYGDTLNAGVFIKNKPDVTRRVNDMLARHGRSVSKAVDSVTPDKSISPDFPAKAGVAQAFSQFSRFWPIGILTIAIEMLIPITLWTFAYLHAFWRRWELENKRSAGGHDAI